MNIKCIVLDLDRTTLDQEGKLSADNKKTLDELIAKGQKAKYDTILKEIQQRDYQDSHREIAPLKMARDSIKVDTSEMTIEEVVATIWTIVREKTGL